MNEPTSILNDLSELPASELRDAVEALVVDQFKGVLLMDQTDELPLDSSFFDLGLTSLRLTEIKQSLENLLDLGIDATVLFNQPTVEQLVTYLTTLLSDVLASVEAAS